MKLIFKPKDIILKNNTGSNIFIHIKSEIMYELKQKNIEKYVDDIIADLSDKDRQYFNTTVNLLWFLKQKIKEKIVEGMNICL